MVPMTMAKIIFYESGTIMEQQHVFKTLHLHPE